MNDKLLTFKDYKEIVEHCLQCKGSYGIKDSVNGLIKNYGRFNLNLELSFMEYLESTYEDIQFKKELAPRDFLNFSEEIPKNKHAALDYLYSYLINLSELKYNKNIDKVSEPVAKLNGNKENGVQSFGVRSKHKKILMEIIENLNDDRLTIYDDDKFPARLANLFTAKNLNELSDEERELKFLCKTTEIVVILDMIKIKFDAPFNDYLIDECFICTKQNGQLKSGNIHKTRSTTNPLGNKNLAFIKTTFGKFTF